MVQEQDPNKVVAQMMAEERQAEEMRKAYEAQEAANAAAREALDLELQLAEAKASGNKAEVARLEWMRDYNRLLKEAQDAGMGDDAFSVAIRGANAQAPQQQREPYQKAGVSVQAGAQAANLAALTRQAVTKPQDATRQVAENTKRLVERQDELIRIVQDQAKQVDEFTV